MSFLQMFASSPNLAMLAAALFGLAIGSFLNVVIVRLPRMMEREWEAQCREFALQKEAAESAAAHPADMLSAEIAIEEVSRLPPYNLSVPRSHCPSCQHTLAWYENIPVFSWLALRAKCSNCGQGISWRYPAVELLTAALFAACVAVLGPTFAALAGMGFCAAAVALAFIDADTTLLPDNITLPLLWAGLLVNLWGVFTPISSAVIGAVAGYLFLWLIYWGFKLITGKEGMGYGDFKLLAAIGAWFGWQALPVVILASSIVGVVIGGLQILMHRAERGQALPFGPYLAGAGIIVLLLGGSWTNWLWPV